MCAMLDMSSSNAVDEIKTRDPIYKISYELGRVRLLAAVVFESELLFRR